MGASVYDAEGRRKYLNQAENARFLKAVESLATEHRLFCLTIYYTGCRVSEALNLKEKNIDAEVGCLVIRTLKKRNKDVYRRVIVPSKLLKHLKEFCPSTAEGNLWGFCRSTGWHIIKRVMRNAGIEGPQATLKGLRHGFGVRCAMNKIPVTIIRDWMGHSDISTTEIYLNIRDDEERELIKRTW